MRKQLRSSDILFREHGVRNAIKDVKDIIVERMDQVVTKHLLITTILLDDSNFCQRIRLNPDYFQKELNEYVKEINRLLKEYRYGSNSKN